MRTKERHTFKMAFNEGIIKVFQVTCHFCAASYVIWKQHVVLLVMYSTRRLFLWLIRWKLFVSGCDLGNSKPCLAENQRQLDGYAVG